MEDADVLIVTSAISLAAVYNAVDIIEEDIDFLVLLTGFVQDLPIYFLKPRKGNAKLYITSSYDYSELKNLLLHALSGYNTTSSLFGFGKTKFCILFQNKPAVHELAFSDIVTPVFRLSLTQESIYFLLYVAVTG